MMMLGRPEEIDKTAKAMITKEGKPFNEVNLKCNA